MFQFLFIPLFISISEEPANASASRARMHRTEAGAPTGRRSRGNGIRK